MEYECENQKQKSDSIERASGKCQRRIQYCGTDYVKNDQDGGRCQGNECDAPGDPDEKEHWPRLHLADNSSQSMFAIFSFFTPSFVLSIQTNVAAPKFERHNRLTRNDRLAIELFNPPKEEIAIVRHNLIWPNYRVDAGVDGAIKTRGALPELIGISESTTGSSTSRRICPRGSFLHRARFDWIRDQLVDNSSLKVAT